MTLSPYKLPRKDLLQRRSLLLDLGYLASTTSLLQDSQLRRKKIAVRNRRSPTTSKQYLI